jgi:hypothetical protein
MRTFLIVMASILVVSVSTSVYAIDVYIVAGQSNGWRISTLAQGGGKLKGKIHYFGMKCVSEPTQGRFRTLTGLNEKTMGSVLGKSLSDISSDDIVFIQFCRCGAGVWDKRKQGWYPGDDPKNGKVHDDGLYGCFTQYIKHARGVVEHKLKLKWEVKGLFWHQGESDSRAEHVGKYEDRLGNLFYRFRNDLGANLPIVIGPVRELNDLNKKINAITKKMADADANMAVIDVKGLTFESPTNVHFNRAGCHEMTRRMAAAYGKMASLHK